VGENCLHEAVCRERPEKWVRVGYMKLCVDRDMNGGDIWLQEAVSRMRPKLWVTLGHMKLCLEKDLNHG